MEEGKAPAPLETLETIVAVLQVVEELNCRTNYRIEGERPLSGSIEVRSSKNAAVALLCASLINRGA